MESPLRIAIIGAGPSGCTLARIFQKSALATASPPYISVTVFESDATPSFRKQGGSLDIHDATGQQALREAGLYAEFLRHARYDGEAAKFADKNLVCYVSFGPKAPPKLNPDGTSSLKPSKLGGRPEIDRALLREMLYQSLHEGIVVWGKKTARIEADEKGVGTIHFADGTSEGGFDLIVGADGTWSKTRPFVSSAVPFFSGVAGHSMVIPDAATRAPEIYALVNRGSLFSWSDHKSLMFQQLGDGSITISSWQTRDDGPEWRSKCGYDVNDAVACREAVGRAFADWDPRLLKPTQESIDDSLTETRDLYMLPIGHRWGHKRGVTLVGDAAHVMTPFAGEGVNLAMTDSMCLSQHIVNGLSKMTIHNNQPRREALVNALDAAVKNFEDDMFVRATIAQQLTWDMMQLMYFTPGAPNSVLEKFVLTAMRHEVGAIGTFLLTPLVYAYFFVFRLFWARAH